MWSAVPCSCCCFQQGITISGTAQNVNNRQQNTNTNAQWHAFLYQLIVVASGTAAAAATVSTGNTIEGTLAFSLTVLCKCRRL